MTTTTEQLSAARACGHCGLPTTQWTRNVSAAERTEGARGEHHHHRYGHHGQHVGGPCVCDATDDPSKTTLRLEAQK